MKFIKPIILTPEIASKIEGIIITKNSCTLDLYSLDINRSLDQYNCIAFTLHNCNQYIWIHQGELKDVRQEDETVTIYNADLNGLITLNKLQNIYTEITGKQLKINL